MGCVKSLYVSSRPETSALTIAIVMDTSAPCFAGIATGSRERYLTWQIEVSAHAAYPHMLSYFSSIGRNMTRRDAMIWFIILVIKQQMRNELNVIVKPVLQELRNELYKM